MVHARKGRWKGEKTFFKLWFFFLGWIDKVGDINLDAQWYVSPKVCFSSALPDLGVMWDSLIASGGRVINGDI